MVGKGVCYVMNNDKLSLVLGNFTVFFFMILIVKSQSFELSHVKSQSFELSHVKSQSF